MPIKFKTAKHVQKLQKLRQQSEELMVEVYSKKYGVKYIDLSLVPINTDALRVIPENRARAHGMAAFNLVGRKLFLAVLSPLPDFVQEEIKRLESIIYGIQTFYSKSMITLW